MLKKIIACHSVSNDTWYYITDLPINKFKKYFSVVLENVLHYDIRYEFISRKQILDTQGEFILNEIESLHKEYTLLSSLFATIRSKIKDEQVLKEIEYLKSIQKIKEIIE